MSDELSDEAFWEWHDNHALKNSASFSASLLAWRECRRRATIMIENEMELRIATNDPA